MKRNFTAAIAAMLLVTGLLSPVGSMNASAAEPLKGNSPDSAVTKVENETIDVLKAFTDVSPSHWAAGPLQRWSANGIISGYDDGSFQPGKEVTKAEFAAIMNRIFNYQEQSDKLPADVLATDWYKSDIAKGIAAGYLSSDKNNNIYPSHALSRAEAALSLEKVFRFNTDKSSTAGFTDLNGISDETAKAIAALSSAGFIKGYPGGLFKPEGGITRAELAQLADRMVSGLILKSGETSLGTVKGNVIINHADVVLKDTVIQGNLYLTEGIAEGNAKLEGVKVTGTTFVRGGGEQSIGLHNASIGPLQVAKPNGKVRIYASGSTTVDTVQLQSGAILEESSDLTGAGFGDIEMNVVPHNISLRGIFGAVRSADSVVSGSLLRISGTIASLTVGSPTQLTLENNAYVSALILTASAGGTVIQGSGSVTSIDNKADGVTIGGSPVQKGNTGKTTLPVATSAPSNSGNVGPTPTNDPWTLVWGDEFNEGTIDPTKWTYDLGDGSQFNNPGWGNNEKQWYTSDEKNAKVQDGNLVITAHKEAVSGKEYTSARLKTKGLFSKKYGKFEIRAKAPTGKGYWPAIWMLPENYEYGNWASSGELDIMEGWGSRPNTVAGTIHYGGEWPNNVYSGKEYVFPEGSTIEQFHTYSIEWEPGEIRWYVDGELFLTKNDWYSISNGQPANNAYPAPFNQEFHLLLNLAVGGNFDGDPTPETVFPKSMQVDYVRVYELTGREYREPIPVTLEKEAYLEGSKLALPDGNLVYNNNFTEQVPGDNGMGIPNTSHWVLFKEPGADATVSTVPIGGHNFVKVNISNAGGNVYSVQPQAIVSVAKGRFYKLSFDAKTDVSRNISVKLTGGESRGFAAYSPALKAELTSEMTHFETMFQMKENSDIATRIEFNMGTNASPVWLGNVRLEEVDRIPFDHDGIKTPLGSGNHLYNGTFDLGEPNRMSYWHVETAKGATAAAKVDDKGKLNVKIGGSESGEVRLLQKGIQLIQGQDYELAFNAAVSSARTATVQLLGKDGSVHAQQSVNLAQGEQEIKASFTNLAGATDHEGQFILILNGAADTVILDNFKLLRTSFYYDPSLVYYPLVNGEFNAEFLAWDRLLTEQGGQSTATATDGTAKFNITNTGSQPYSVMLFQNNLKAASGIDYVLEFDASSTIARKIGVNVENASYQASFTNIVELTPATTHYKFEFRQGSKDTLSLKFLLGKVEGNSIPQSHDIIIDNVKFEIKNAPAKPQELISDSSNNRVSQPIELTFIDHEDWRKKIVAVKVNGTTLETEQYTIEPGKITIDAAVFPSEGNYTITVEADHYANGYVLQTILANDNNLVINGSFGSDKTGWSTWSGEGGVSAFDVKDGVAEILITSAGWEAWHTQFYQEGIPLEGGKTYEVSFKAKSTVPRQIILEYSNTSAASAQAKFDITADWATYGAQFTVSNSNPLKLNYLIGKSQGTDPTANSTPHTISFDDIVVREVQGGPPVTPPSGTLDNGSFDVDSKGWSQYFDGTGSAAVKDGEFAIDLTGTGQAAYSAQVDYENLKLIQGKTYTLKFKARSTVNRNIQGAVEHKGGDYTKYMEAELIALTQNMKEFSYTFTMNGATDAGVHLVFLLGLIDGNSTETNSEIGAGSTIYLDDVSLIES
ncbi:beta-glucanase (GH16 family) [Paenibacillus sp. PastF-3]|uniref:carbohydrate binding domain-containing protein n=1 Tax=Paenibacillus sp. PastF-3 TaxID=2940626 RepID=UPI00247386C4|nr:carbohydrate binding domain-containing protein [Paenibacillus sp. PastF-3]MDH6373600.1 beta-glucanase (GH16 family) [Paenibacillus sp. PastF-3]